MVPELLQIYFGSSANVFGLLAVRNISEKNVPATMLPGLRGPKGLMCYTDMTR